MNNDEDFRRETWMESLAFDTVGDEVASSETEVTGCSCAAISRAPRDRQTDHLPAIHL